MPAGFAFIDKYKAPMSKDLLFYIGPTGSEFPDNSLTAWEHLKNVLFSSTCSTEMQGTFKENTLYFLQQPTCLYIIFYLQRRPGKYQTVKVFPRGSDSEPMACVPRLACRALSAGTQTLSCQIATLPLPTQPNLRRWLQPQC